ncbi:MAG: dTDP-4-dehydrorhamnose reductase [Rhodospirillales bacterium]|nr:MAG: dTDP-4-dehydrorhamnose reductase [Rhodospirillales bacterium]
MAPEPAKVLVVGRSGQVASALRAAAWPGFLALEWRGRESLDLRRPEAVAEAVRTGGWAAVINAAAYTQVDRAETEREDAWAVNRNGPAALAESCGRAGIPLIHLSTDYAFDGTKAEAYVETDAVNPASFYGLSKAEGEAAVRDGTAAHVIVRTSWVFSPVGTNFVKTMLRLGRERKELRIVDDQRGRPTAAADIADAVSRILAALLTGKSDGFGTFHFAGAGATSWHGFAREIFRQAALRGFAPVPAVTAIPTSAYPTPARRPINSVLDTTRIERVYGIVPRRWEDALGETLDALVRPAESTARKEVMR